MKKALFLLLVFLLVGNAAQGAPLIVDFEAVPEQYYLDGDWTQATGNLDGFYDGLWFGRYAGIYVTGMINYNDDVYRPHSGEKVLASGQSSGVSTTIGVQFQGGATNSLGCGIHGLRVNCQVGLRRFCLRSVIAPILMCCTERLLMYKSCMETLFGRLPGRTPIFHFSQ